MFKMVKYYDGLSKEVEKIKKETFEITKQNMEYSEKSKFLTDYARTNGYIVDSKHRIARIVDVLKGTETKLGHFLDKGTVTLDGSEYDVRKVLGDTRKLAADVFVQV